MFTISQNFSLVDVAYTGILEKPTWHTKMFRLYIAGTIYSFLGNAPNKKIKITSKLNNNLVLDSDFSKPSELINSKTLTGNSVVV